MEMFLTAIFVVMMSSVAGALVGASALICNYAFRSITESDE